MAVLDATETGCELSQPKFEFTSLLIVVLHSSVTTQKYNRTTTSSPPLRRTATYFLLLFELDDVVRSEKDFCLSWAHLKRILRRIKTYLSLRRWRGKS